AGDKLGRYPFLLADHTDNTGGGAPGDSTEVLRTLLELGLEDALILYMVDREAVELARTAGVGARSACNWAANTTRDRDRPSIARPRSRRFRMAASLTTGRCMPASPATWG